MKKLYMTLAAALLAAPALFAQNEIYLVGAPQGWDINSEDMPLEMTSDGVYKGRYYVDDSQFTLRFYTALGDWETNSIGSQEVDSPINISFPSGVYSGPCVNGKGSWAVPNWPGGNVEFTVDLNNMTVNFATDIDVPEPEVPEPNGDVIYLIGDFQGWQIDNGDMPLKLVEEGVYSASYEVNAEEMKYFRFYTALGNWDENSIGASSDNNPVVFTDGVFTDTTTESQFCWTLENYAGAITFTVDLNNNTVKFEEGEAGEVPEGPGPALDGKIYIVGSFQGWDINGDTYPIYEEEAGVFKGAYEVEAGDIFFRFYTALGNWEENSIGAQEVDEAVAITLTEGVYEGACVNGKGSWEIAEWNGGYLTFTVDLNNMTVLFQEGDHSGVAGIDANVDGYTVYTLQGVRVLNNASSLNGLNKGLYIVNGKKVVIR